MSGNEPGAIKKIFILLGLFLLSGWFYWIMFVSFTGYWPFVFGRVSAGVQFLVGRVSLSVEFLVGLARVIVAGFRSLLPYAVGIVVIVAVLSAVRGYTREGERVVIGNRDVLEPGLHFVWSPFIGTHRVSKETTVRQSLDGVRAADGTAVIASYELKYRVDDALQLIRTFGSGYRSEIRLIAEEAIREVIENRSPAEIAPDDTELLSQIQNTIETKIRNETNTQGVITVEYVELVMPNMDTARE